MQTENDLAFFVLLARKKSFAATALELGLSAPAVSKRLARLEERLGVKLLNRTTRRVSLTSEGEAYLDRATGILRDIDDLNDSITAAGRTPRGLLRINATLGFGREYVAPAVADFTLRHPEVEAQLILTDSPINLVAEGFDLGIWFGAMANSRLVARKLQSNRRLLCASPDYLERHGEPRRLEDLERHNCILLRQNLEAHDVWKFQRRDRIETIRVSGRLSSNDGEAALGWALDGHGIMVRAEWDIHRHVEAGRLKIILPDYSQPDSDIHAVFSQKLHLSAKVRFFIDFLGERLAAVRRG